MNEQLAEDGRPLDYVDGDGVQWVMCACGHRAGGGVHVGDKRVLCPNCAFRLRFENVTVIYPDRLPDGMVVPDA